MAKRTQAIVIDGARTHNLRVIHCEIPHQALTVVTGVSGSGKSSLAFDTLYAEGQRRYVESMSTYARQFLERLQRHDVDSVSGILPAIALEQRNSIRNARSTVGTVTEVSDYLRLLFARIGEVHCHSCDGQVARDTAQAATDAVLKRFANGRGVVIAQVQVGRSDSVTRFDELRKQGYHRLFLDGKLVGEEVEAETLRPLRSLPAVVDRLQFSIDARSRLADALHSAFALGEGRAEVHADGEAPLYFNEGYVCSSCGHELKVPTPALFSFNSPIGACPECQGFGRAVGIDFDKVIPDGRKSIEQGAIAPFQTPSNRDCQRDLMRANKALKALRSDVPWSELSAAEKKWVIEGDVDYKRGDWKRGKWYGINGFFKYLEGKKYKMHVRVLLARYRGYGLCGGCHGARLRQEALAVRVGTKHDQKSIAELDIMPISALRPFLRALEIDLPKQTRLTAQRLFSEVDSRLSYLDRVGLGYLTLARQARTLSGGESQRIALASALGAQLTGTLYVLDEPSVGLHPRDTARLTAVLKQLTERGNTVVVVEHDPDLMAAADHILDLGPGAGAHGGSVVFSGPYGQLIKKGDSSTGRYLRTRQPSQFADTSSVREKISIIGARANNLQNIDVEFPVGKLSTVSGVSGSGKSSLVVDVLHAQALRARGKPVDSVGECKKISGLDRFTDVILVDQSPLGRSSRSNPLTYLGAMDELRKLFSKTSDARKLGLLARSFSFNVSTEKGGGRCEACQGQGTLTLEMHFLADVTVVCDRCWGKRFGEKVLGVKWNSLSILDCLRLTVDQALQRFASEKKLTSRLKPFAEVGLGYLALGQPTATLSGGESQRLKLAAHLHAPEGRSLFILDEPTTGLHGLDVAVLLSVLRRLVAVGHTLIVVEHNLDFIAASDYLVDLGPEGGDGGGRIVACGTPAEISRVRASHTGVALRPLFDSAAQRPSSLRKNHSKSAPPLRPTIAAT